MQKNNGLSDIDLSYVTDTDKPERTSPFEPTHMSGTMLLERPNRQREEQGSMQLVQENRSSIDDGPTELGGPNGVVVAATKVRQTELRSWINLLYQLEAALDQKGNTELYRFAMLPTYESFKRNEHILGSIDSILPRLKWILLEQKSPAYRQAFLLHIQRLRAIFSAQPTQDRLDEWRDELDVLSFE